MTLPAKIDVLRILQAHPLIKLRHKARRVFVIGSVASGTAKEGSDLDILLEVNTNQDLTSLYRKKIQNYFIKNNLFKDDSVHPQFNGVRIDLYFTSDATNETRPKIELI